jgi:hypothetical protein
VPAHPRMSGEAPARRRRFGRTRAETPMQPSERLSLGVATKEEKATTPDWLHPQLTAAALIAYCSAMGYVIAFAYESAYCSVFGIPVLLIRVSLNNVVVAFGYLALGVIGFAVISFLLFGWRQFFRGPMRTYLPIAIASILPSSVPLIVHPSSFREVWVLCAASAAVLLFFGLVGIAHVRERRAVAAGLPKEAGLPLAALTRINRAWTLLLVFSGFSALSAANIGQAEARGAAYYWVTEEPEPRALVRSYADYAIFLRKEDIRGGADKTDGQRMTVVPLSALADKPLVRKWVDR